MADQRAATPKPPRKRPLASLLVEQGLFDSEGEALGWILAGQVLVNGRPVDKPRTPINPKATLEVRGRNRFVSRGGYKLDAALDHFHVAVAGRIVLDCGASTGGFTDCLLQRNAALIYAVEVGYGQLSGRLRNDQRVRNMERTNLSDPRLGLLDPRPTLITLDLSYLSLTDALPPAASLLAPGGDLLALFKPLFEVDDAEARRTGRIPNDRLIVLALQRVLDVGSRIRVRPIGAAKLALRPRHGVSEYFLHFAAGADAETWRYTTDTLTDIIADAGIGKQQEETQ